MNNHTAQSREALRDAITMAGSPAKLAEKLREKGFETSRQAIEYWRDKRVDGVPEEAARVINRLYRIPLYKLRPDTWPRAVERVPHRGKVR